jgi:hypothetical protein
MRGEAGVSVSFIGMTISSGHCYEEGSAMAARPPSQIDILLKALDEAFEKKAWHGPNLRGCLRGVSAKEAAFRPAPGRHNIWEHAVHAAYWKYAVRRRLSGEERGSFPLEGSNWFRRPEGAADDKAWKADVALLTREHRLLRSAVASYDPRKLKEVPPGGKVIALSLITGIASHDLYHTGQIQLLKRLARG